MLQKVLSLCLLSLAGVSAKRPGQVWITTLNDGFRQLFEGDRTTMADFFSSDARVCFNNECGGQFRCWCCYVCRYNTCIADLGPEYFDQFSLTSDFSISSHHELSEGGDAVTFIGTLKKMSYWPFSILLRGIRGLQLWCQDEARCLRGDEISPYRITMSIDVLALTSTIGTI